jgi:Mg/Co/Ni transporter MgtE
LRELLADLPSADLADLLLDLAKKERVLVFRAIPRDPAAIATFRAPEIVLVVSVTMMLIVMVGSLIGMSLPFLLTRFGLDPATASPPLITSISDICGVLIYFSIASWYLGIG